MPDPEQRKIPLTTVGRPLDWKVMTNRVITTLFFGVLVVGSIALTTQDVPLNAAAFEALSLAGALFFGWMLGREIDPDRWYSAFIAAAFAGANAFFVGAPHFLLLFWIAIGLRFVNRTSGEGPGILDFIAYFGIIFWLGHSTHWAVPLLALPTLPFAGLERFPRWSRIALPAALAAAGVVFGFTQAWQLVFISPAERSGLLIIICLVAAASLPVIWSYNSVRSVGDRGGKPLEPHRVQWGITWAVGIGMILTLIAGMTIVEMAPLWAAIVASFIGWLIGSTLSRIQIDRKRRGVRRKITRR